ncbi:permease [Helicobacter sp. 13S00401-1]|uniref:LptF/LptG family permease n=1 Tax=Helicobacter sp. 13S00401-1 TaxID=1905758 RepID=UPI000BA7BEF2|nr:LptF/LptG family permease [Helicobacter sp. 13S00401-1]PAF51458.1 permease [Helicobacter sp. 13S00401-1]
MMLFNFISYRYIKILITIFLALELFFVSIDSLQYFEHMPDSVNLIILFYSYEALYALNYVLPISLLLAVVVFYISLIKTNQYAALLALGYSKKIILAPVLTINIIILVLFIILNITPFVYAQEKVENIVYQGSNMNTANNLFVKYKDSYIFFGKIYPLLQTAQNIKVFKVDNKKLVSVSSSKEAVFKNNEWILKNVSVMDMPKDYEIGHPGITIKTYDNVHLLHGFRPKVLDTIYQNKPSVSIYDALTSMKILYKAHAEFGRVRGIFYTLTIIQFFVIFTSIIVVYYSPVLARYGNLALNGIIFSVFCLIMWGVFFSLGKLSANNLFIPEFGLLIPFVILAAVGSYCFSKLNHI